MYGVAPGTGAADLLARLQRPYDPERTIAALLGLAPRTARQLVGAVLAGLYPAWRMSRTSPAAALRGE